MGYGGKDYGYSEAGYGYGVSAFTGFDGLSIIPDTLGWWSVARRVLNRYAGPAIRLRRSSDSAERDFYGIGPQGEVSTADVRAWNGWNLLARSNEFGTSPWSLNAASFVASQATAPNGVSAGTLAANGVSEQHYCNQSSVFATGVRQTLSVIVKAVTATHLHVLITTQNIYAQFNLSTGALVHSSSGTGTLHSATATSLGDGWYFVQVSATQTSGSAVAVRFYPLAAANNTPGPTETSTASILISSSQLERASSFSTYEPRTTTAAGDSFLVTLYDQSGLARHFTQSTTTLQPIICEQGVPVTENGRLAAKFVAADARRMSVASSTAMFNALHTTGGTVLAVSKANDTAATKVLLTNQTGSTDAGFRIGTLSNENVSVVTGRLDDAGVATNGNSILMASIPSGSIAQTIRSFVFDPDNATAASRFFGWENGTAMSGANAATGTPFVENAQGVLTLGATVTGGTPHDGPISELALFSAAISTADRTAYQSRSGIFYGVTIS